jgi:hypothetical protein
VCHHFFFFQVAACAPKGEQGYTAMELSVVKHHSCMLAAEFSIIARPSCLHADSGDDVTPHRHARAK